MTDGLLSVTRQIHFLYKNEFLERRVFVKKHFLSLFAVLLVALLALFSLPALADSPTELWVNGVNILAPDATLPEGVSYEDGVLTLQGVTIDSADSAPPFGICSDCALTIVLKGQNSIAGEDFECGIYLDSGALTLSGEGSLEVSGSDCGIAAYAGVTVEDSVSELTVSGPSGAFYTYDGAPITIGETEYDPYSDLFQIVTVENGELISNEWLPPTKLYVNGVDILAPDATLPKGVSYEDGVLTLNGVTIDSVSDSAPPFGIYANNALTIVLEGQNSIAGEGIECGIYLDFGALTLSGDGSLEVSGSFYGIAARAGVTVENSVSELTVSGNDGHLLLLTAPPSPSAEKIMTPLTTCISSSR